MKKEILNHPLQTTDRMDRRVRIGLIGATGRLGRQIATLCQTSDTHLIGAYFHSKAPIKEDLSLDIYLDVSVATQLSHHLNVAKNGKKPIVIGTTGDIDHSLLREAAGQIPVLYASNFSLGMYLLRQAALLFAKHYPEASIEEVHHIHKKDTPSGSALTLQKELSLDYPFLPIQSLREGETLGIHTLHFFSKEERLSVSHEVQDRMIFAQGALEAVTFLASQPPGLYSMEDVLSLKKNLSLRNNSSV